MISDASDTLLRLNFAHPLEVVRSQDYFWDNARREEGLSIIQYTLSGAGCFAKGEQEWEVPTGMAMIMRQGEGSRYFYPARAVDPWSFAWVNFCGGEAVLDAIVKAYGPVIPLAPTGAAASLLVEIGRRDATSAFIDRFDSSEWLCRLFSAVARELTHVLAPPRSLPERLQLHLEEHCRRPVNIKSIAGELGCSREHLTRLYREHYGRSPAAELRRLRLRAAADLLTATSLSIGAIAQSSGFSSAPHLNRVFTEARAITPADYRARIRTDGQ